MFLISSLFFSAFKQPHLLGILSNFSSIIMHLLYFVAQCLLLMSLPLLVGWVGMHAFARNFCRICAATGRKKSKISSSIGTNWRKVNTASMIENSEWLCKKNSGNWTLVISSYFKKSSWLLLWMRCQITKCHDYKMCQKTRRHETNNSTFSKVALKTITFHVIIGERNLMSAQNLINKAAYGYRNSLNFLIEYK